MPFIYRGRGRSTEKREINGSDYFSDQAEYQLDSVLTESGNVRSPRSSTVAFRGSFASIISYSSIDDPPLVVRDGESRAGDVEDNNDTDGYTQHVPAENLMNSRFTAAQLRAWRTELGSNNDLNGNKKKHFIMKNKKGLQRARSTHGHPTHGHLSLPDHYKTQPEKPIKRSLSFFRRKKKSHHQSVI